MSRLTHLTTCRSADAGAPITGALLALAMWPDERCGTLSQKNGLSPDERAEMDGCRARQTKQEALTDDAGRYAFGPVGAGWYMLTVEWALDGPPKKSGLSSMGWSGELLTAVLETRDVPKKYFIRGATKTFTVDGASDMTFDCPYVE